MHEPFGFVRLQALPAPDVWHARAALTLYAVAPRSTVTVALDVAGLKPGDLAGFALFRRPFVWLGVEHLPEGLVLAQFDEHRGSTSRVPLGSRPVWLRMDCDFTARTAGFSFSTDGRSYVGIGEPCPVCEGAVVAFGIPCSLFACAAEDRAESGHAVFHSFLVTTESGGPDAA